MHKSASVLLCVLVALLAGCAMSDFEGAGEDQPSLPGPGDTSWKPGGPLQCTRDDDCESHEGCVAGSCRLKGCAPDAVAPESPLGEQRYFATRRELVAAEGSALHAYKLTGGTLTRPAGVTDDWSAGGALIDVAGGHFLTSRPESLAVALSGAKKITIIGPSERFDLALSFVPRALASGDVDGDGFDEVVAFDATGQIALCHPRVPKCTGADFSHVAWEGLDVAVADVDGDRYAEPIFLAMEGARRVVVVWNVTHVATHETTTLKVEPGKTDVASVVSIERIAGGDLDGDGAAELIGFENRGLLTDKVYTFALADGRMPKLAEASVGFSARDIVVDDLDVAGTSAGRAEIAVLSSDSAVRLLRLGTGGLKTLEQFLDVELAGTSAGQRLAAADIDGDSPMGRLIEGPRLVSGDVQPIAVLTFPPYSRTYSDGAAGVELGVGTSVTDSKWTSVSVTHGVSIGYGFGLGKLFDVSLGGGYSYSRSWDWGLDQTVSVSNSWSLGSREDIYGSDYAGVVVESGCFAAYTYEVEDPADVIDGDADKKTFTVFAPAGGQTTLWASARYNAMAKELGYLPKLGTPFTLGDPSSYPSQMITLEGNLVAQEQLLFTDPPSYRVSDIGDVSWSLSGSTSTTNGKTTTFGLSGSVGLTVGSVDLGYSYDKSWSKGGGISVGQDISFAGWVPSISDDPSTPEDEYENLGFGFTPYVYRQVYSLPSGAQSAYYVLMYQVRP